MGGLGDARFLLMEGGTLGDLYSLVDLKYDNNNAIYVDEEGNLPTQSIEDVKKFIKLGSVLPDANMSWRNDFRWKNLNFGFMVSARLGGIVFSRTQATLDYFGVSEATAAARDRGGVLINGRDMIDANVWYSAVARRQFPAPVLHLLGDQRPSAGGFDRLHDPPQMAAQRLRDHRIPRRPQPLDDLQQSAVRPRVDRYDGQLLSGSRLLHDAVAAERGIQPQTQILKLQPL